MAIDSVMPSYPLILCHSLLLLPSIFPSIRVCSSESALHIRWPNYYSFSTSPPSEYSGLISFRIDWVDLLAIQGTLESSLVPQFESIRSQVVLLSYPIVTDSWHHTWLHLSCRQAGGHTVCTGASFSSEFFGGALHLGWCLRIDMGGIISISMPEAKFPEDRLIQHNSPLKGSVE